MNKDIADIFRAHEPIEAAARDEAWGSLNQSNALLQAILDNPADDLRRLVYADWLEENGEAERADFMRAWMAAPRKNRLYTSFHNGHWGTCSAPPDHPGPIAFWAMEGKDADSVAWLFAGFTEEEHWHLTIRRGFVADVWCPQQAWLDHGPTIVRAHPVERVRLTDVRPVHQDRDPGFACWTFAYTRLSPNISGLFARGYFHTEEDAIDAMSAACLTLAKGATQPDLACVPHAKE